MRDLAADVMHDVRLTDPMRDRPANPPSDAAEKPWPAHERAVKGGKSSSGERERRGLVVWKGWVGMLEEGD